MTRKKNDNAIANFCVWVKLNDFILKLIKYFKININDIISVILIPGNNIASFGKISPRGYNTIYIKIRKPIPLRKNNNNIVISNNT